MSECVLLSISPRTFLLTPAQSHLTLNRNTLHSSPMFFAVTFLGGWFRA